MQRLFITIVICLCASIGFKNLTAQAVYNLSFKKDSLVLHRGLNNITIPVFISLETKDKEKLKSLQTTLWVDEINTSLPANAFSIFYVQKKLSAVGNADTAFITLNADSLPDRDRTIVLKVGALNEQLKNADTFNISKNNQLVVKIPAIVKKDTVIDSTIKNYGVLAYLGSNFDLANRQVFTDLFFAVNVLKTPRQNNSRSGFYLSIYGNTSMANRDSSSSTRFTTRDIRINDSTKREYSMQADVFNTTQSKNVGAQVNYLFRVSKKNDAKSDLQLFVTPNLEFIWRRITYTKEYRNLKNEDSLDIATSRPFNTTYASKITSEESEYVFNLGAGLFLVYENADISVRVHGSLNKQGLYFGNQSAKGLSGFNTEADWAFTGRAWITEPVTGITLQAEVQNSLGVKRPFFGATLSKAFKIKALASLFTPLVK